MPPKPASSFSMQQAQALASDLRLATRGRRPIAPLTQHHTVLALEEAYAIQQAGIDHLVAEGDRVIGYKLGFTSIAKQEAMGIQEPIYGTLLRSMRLEPGQGLSLAGLIHPKVEPEIAFVLRTPVAGPEVTAKDVLAATVSLHPALDVLDSRFQGFKFSLTDVIADNASGAAFVLGPPGDPLDESVLMASVASFFRNGQLASQGAGRDVMGNPAEAVAWLARQLSKRGQALAAGAVVLSGSLVAPLDAEAGDEFEARLDGIGRIDLRVEKGAP